MFTGIVEEIGRIRNIRKGEKSVSLTVECGDILEGTLRGDSISVNGVCLTVTAMSGSSFEADVMPETVRRTVLSFLKPGDPVNLERTLRLGDRMGGHIVTGHIDGIGYIRNVAKDDNAVIFRIEARPELLRYIVSKGSIAIDGISLTIVEGAGNWFAVSVIPHTYAVTTLGVKGIGSPVNIEVDTLGKHMEKAGLEAGRSGRIDMNFLAEHGFLS